MIARPLRVCARCGRELWTEESVEWEARWHQITMRLHSLAGAMLVVIHGPAQR